MAAAPGSDLIEQLYLCAEVLNNAKDKAGEHENEFRTILGSVRSSAGSGGASGVKRLASQFIARFAPKFPGLGNESLDAILDLCEDDDLNIRKQAIKDLPLMCRGESKQSKEYLPKIADVLTQLLQTDEPSEVNIIQSAIMSLMRKDCKGTLIGLFCQIKTGGDLVRERALKFLFVKLKTEGKDLLNKEGEVHLFEEIKACTFEGCSAEEFHMFMSMLSYSSIPKTVAGQSMIVEMISKMIDFDKNFDSDDEEAVDRTIQCFQAASEYFSSMVKSTKFCEYLCLSVLPEWDALLSTDQAKLLRILAETCAHTSDNLEKPDEATANVNTVLMEYLPEVPTSSDESGAADSEARAVEFTKVECLLFAFHTVGQMSSFPDKNPELFKELKTRLQHFALGIQGYMRKLRENLAGKSGGSSASSSSPEYKVKAEALKSTTNINSLIKDLLHTPPSFKTKIRLSWKEEEKVAKPALKDGSSAAKRKSITFDEKSASARSDSGVPKKKFAKTPMKPSARGGGGGGRGGSGGGGKAGGKGGGGGGTVYSPPTGKYSGGLQAFSGNSKGGSGQKRRRRSRGGGGGGQKKSF